MAWGGQPHERPVDPGPGNYICSNMSLDAPHTGQLWGGFSPSWIYPQMIQRQRFMCYSQTHDANGEIQAAGVVEPVNNRPDRIFNGL